MALRVLSRPEPRSQRDGIPGRFPVLRASLVYVVLFSASGFFQPFFPIWLAARQLSQAEIGLVIALPMLLRIFVTPLFCAAADRDRSGGAGVVRLLALLVLALALALTQAQSFWTILVLSCAMMLFSQSVSPIVDASVLSLVRRGIAPDFGRIRLWGSISFAGASVAGGFVLGLGGPDWVFAVFVVAVGLQVLASFFLPMTTRSASGGSGTSLRLFSRPLLLVVLVATALVLASHATFNTFGSVHLREIGYADRSIGMLWAVATGAEIAMFWTGPVVAKVLGPFGMLALASAAAVLRWSLMSLDVGFGLTAALQLLHAATFSGSYIGLMRFIQTGVTDGVAARVQSAFVTLLGLMTAATTLAMGPLYRELGTGAFQVSALLPLVALILLLAFRSPLSAAVARNAQREADRS